MTSIFSKNGAFIALKRKPLFLKGMLESDHHGKIVFKKYKEYSTRTIPVSLQEAGSVPIILSTNIL